MSPRKSIPSPANMLAFEITSLIISFPSRNASVFQALVARGPAPVMPIRILVHLPEIIVAETATPL